MDVGVFLAVPGEDGDRVGGLAEGRDGGVEDLLLAGRVDVGVPDAGGEGWSR
jgi:hypothetical protein